VRAMDDASLVAAALGGDGAAWAAIYGRYADRLHDHCHRILHDRDEAADALHDAFIAASQNLGQLRDPARLRPWLYSICRHEALRRAEQRSRVDLTDELDEMNADEVDFGREARVEELQGLVWAAAAGLNPRDQALLDLNLRQGLEGQDLADAMGTSLNNSYVMLSRLRDQVERSLGALLIARLGRDDCIELDDLLAGWDGRFSPVLRKRVARHVDACEVCREQRAALVSPLALLAAFPLVPAPTGLRDRVLGGISDGSGGVVPISFTSAGFAAASGGIDRTRSRVPLLGAVAAAVLLLVGLFIAQLGGDPATELTAAGEPITTTTDEHDGEVADEAEDEPGSSTSSTSSTTSTSTTSTSSTTTTTVPSVVVPPTAPPPPPTTTTTTAPSDTTEPSIASVSSSAAALNTTSCNSGLPKTTTISATITDASPVDAVLYWSGAGSGQATMSGSGTYSASFGNFANGGTVTYHVVATDAAGNQSTSPSGAIRVDPCPQ
jgi:RNA polymerase sigma factor (sigma-70 family)